MVQRIGQMLAEKISRVHWTWGTHNDDDNHYNTEHLLCASHCIREALFLISVISITEVIHVYDNSNKSSVQVEVSFSFTPVPPV